MTCLIIKRLLYPYSFCTVCTIDDVSFYVITIIILSMKYHRFRHIFAIHREERWDWNNGIIGPASALMGYECLNVKHHGWHLTGWCFWMSLLGIKLSSFVFCTPRGARSFKPWFWICFYLPPGNYGFIFNGLFA